MKTSGRSEEHFIVWNEDYTEGFVTNDAGLAYEVRKSSDSNCFTREGRQSKVAQQFCEEWFEHNCTTQTVRLFPHVDMEVCSELVELVKLFRETLRGHDTNNQNALKRVEDIISKVETGQQC